MEKRRYPSSIRSLVSSFDSGERRGNMFKNVSELPPSILEWIEEEGFSVLSVYSFDGTLDYISKNIKKLTNYSWEELIGTNIFHFIHPDDQDYIKQSIYGTGTKKTFTYRILHKDAAYVWVESIVCKVYDRTKNEWYFVMITRDVTILKETEQFYIQSEKMSVAGQLAAGIVHEIRNPITSLKGFLQLMRTGIDLKGEYYKIMEEEIEKIENITSELLFISKPMTNQMESTSITSLLSDVCKLMQSQARLSNVQISYTEGEEVFVRCDKSQMKQVFINLIKNAIEGIEQEGNVYVSIKNERDHVVIYVEDEGVGIPEEIMDKIYDPFFTTKQNGTGLGLMITNQIIEKHRGQLSFHRRPKQGTICRVTLPKK
ncbi:PAS domain-containing sensor histidine kinase [Salirhabdus salicampi]|uniref:PAS domain-containing sensor histidine kinase n=1 Tax=Salirhabdus salicampi TaxID=476102 RepID=UPI0020C5624F|nr:PAS domain-containing sensor histidine kinase [Salirhabdus salicampi]MCP8616417.1 ATP-binding protein [Salirhabdus salicampi]